MNGRVGEQKDGYHSRPGKPSVGEYFYLRKSQVKNLLTAAVANRDGGQLSSFLSNACAKVSGGSALVNTHTEKCQ